MKIETVRGPVEIEEPSLKDLRVISGIDINSAQYADFLRIYTAGARAMRDELERGRGSRLEAALMGAYKDR